MAIQSRNKVSVTFSMSSMTDIVFLLLVFFIIASTMITPSALNIVLPKSGPANAKNQPTTIEVTSDGQYALDGDPIALVSLEGAVTAILKFKDNKGILLKADKDVPLEFVVNVMDIANTHKYKLVLATDPK